MKIKGDIGDSKYQFFKDNSNNIYFLSKKKHTIGKQNLKCNLHSSFIT